MHIIIIGCGRWGAELAVTLSARGHAISVVDRDPQAFARLGRDFSGRTVTGLGFDRGALLQAGIERADGLAAVTASDEANVVTARVARQFFRVPRVVARLYDPLKAEIYRRLGIQTISTTTWGVHRITELLGYSRLDSIASLGHGEIDLVEAEIPGLLVGRRVAELSVPGEIQVVAISRSDHTFVPILGTLFERGDVVHLAVLTASTGRLKALLGWSEGGLR